MARTSISSIRRLQIFLLFCAGVGFLSNIYLNSHFYANDSIKLISIEKDLTQKSSKHISTVDIEANIHERKDELPYLDKEPLNRQNAKVLVEEYSQINNLGHRLAGLNCDAYGGPPNDISQEMIYWLDIPSDAKVSSPFRDRNKFLTFEPDHGGWNNIRMAMETVLVLAHAMGRTLVLPPEADMYLLGKRDNRQKKQFSFQDFFHMDSLHHEHEGIDIISMEEFLTQQGLTGNLKDFYTGEPLEPPYSRVDWNGRDLTSLWDYLRKVGHVRSDWNPNECTAAIPASKDPNDIMELKRMIEIINDENVKPEDFVGKPFPVDAPAIDRLKENSCGRKKLCIYDEEMQDATLVHFQVGLHESSKRLRLLTHFYSFIFFQDWKQDLWAKRFVRDHVRYIDEIMCAASRIINALREKTKQNNIRGDRKNKFGMYDALHVRRGDFQYKKTRIEADELLERSKRFLEKGATLFIATDERKKSFFDPLTQYYSVHFLDDFSYLLKDVNTNYYGMIDQLVASKADIFIGTWWSTFSGYVNRMRGYHLSKNKFDGYKDGTMKSWYFIPDERIEEMQVYHPVRLPLYMREFPTSWRDIDKGFT